MKDWSSLEEAALAMRRLNRAIAGFEVADDDLRAVARQADALAQRLESGTPRLKEDDLTTMPHASAIRNGQPFPVAVGEHLEFDAFSAGGGRLHPSSIGLRLWRDGEMSVAAVATVDPMFQGPPNRVHGGVVALIVDELMGAVNRVTGRRAFTARLTVDLRAAAPIGMELRFRAWRHEVDGRKITLRAEGHSDEGLFVEADGLFIAMAL